MSELHDPFAHERPSYWALLERLSFDTAQRRTRVVERTAEWDTHFAPAEMPAARRCLREIVAWEDSRPDWAEPVEPGRYLFSVYTNYHGNLICSYVVTLPLPDAVRTQLAEGRDDAPLFEVLDEHGGQG